MLRRYRNTGWLTFTDADEVHPPGSVFWFDFEKLGYPVWDHLDNGRIEIHRPDPTEICPEKCVACGGTGLRPKRQGSGVVVDSVDAWAGYDEAMA